MTRSLDELKALLDGLSTRHEHRYDVRDCILYALGVGARPPEDLDLVYEGRGPTVLPTMSTRFAAPPVAALAERFAAAGFPTLMFSTKVEACSALAPAGTVTCDAAVTSFENRGKHLLATVTTSGRQGDVTVFDVAHTLWVGGAATPGAADFTEAPVAEPDLGDVTTWTTEVRPELYAVFRLQEDLTQPLPPDIHIDPEHARNAGLERPTLLGECVLGITYRAARHRFPDTEAPVSVVIRYRKPAYPGDRLRVDLWDHEGLIHAKVHNEEHLVATATIDAAPASSTGAPGSARAAATIEGSGSWS